MDATQKINTAELSKMAAGAKEQTRQIRLAGNIFVGTTFAISIMFAFMWITGQFELTFSKVAITILMPGLFAYGAYLYLRSIKANTEEDWTLANQLTLQIEKAEKQVRLYKNIPLHFLLPMFLIVIVSSYGGYFERTGELMPTLKLALYYLAILVPFGLGYLGVKFEQARKVEPMLSNLKSLQKDLMAD